ncbi:acyl carrier protein [Marimonas arenosa]|uniref:Acyl carrier protein n=1 Tax=Marimonas arenosa TaxID=1795305 RepID=A0AAE4B4R0_9RHOB|nr:acyl carrier protein [Marimonas arenosa]MDQ2089644.1 acyl carrier protein [Marimonas arenosa]
MRNEVREFIIENFLFGDEAEMVDDNDSLMETGIIDSTGVLEVIMFLEEEYTISIEDDELLPENLDSVPAIVRFVGQKLSTPKAQTGLLAVE